MTICLICDRMANLSTPLDLRSMEYQSKCIADLSWPLLKRSCLPIWRCHLCSGKCWHSSDLYERFVHHAELSGPLQSVWIFSKSLLLEYIAVTSDGLLFFGRDLHCQNIPWWCYYKKVKGVNWRWVLTYHKLALASSMKASLYSLIF